MEKENLKKPPVSWDWQEEWPNPMEENIKLSEEEHSSRQEDADKLTEKIRDLLDMELINKVIEKANTVRGKNYIIPKVAPLSSSYDTEYRIYITDNSYFSLDKKYADTTRRLQSLANSINYEYERVLKDIEAEETYKDTKWFRILSNFKNFEVPRNLYFLCGNGTICTVTIDANTEISKLVDKLLEQGITEDAELALVRVNDNDGNRSTLQDRYYYSWVSASNKATPEVFKAANFDPNEKEHELTWGHTDGVREVDRATAEKDRYYYIDGMDKWYYRSSVSFATE